MPLMKDREYRQLQILQPQTQQKRIDSDYYVEGYATTYDQPYVLYEIDGIKYYEVIDRHALDGADQSDIIFQYDHEGKVYARKSNNTLIIESDNHGLFCCADLSKSEASKQMYEEISNGLVTRMSWAFTVAEEDYNRDTRTRTIKKVKKVYDVSAVSIPANDDTEISARSYFAGVAEIEKQELLERRRKQLKLKLKLELEDL
ncbi:MAG: HK97 family phage prohead protease [Mobilitalea sp.]